MAPISAGTIITSVVLFGLLGNWLGLRVGNRIMSGDYTKWSVAALAHICIMFTVTIVGALSACLVLSKALGEFP